MGKTNLNRKWGKTKASNSKKKIQVGNKEMESMPAAIKHTERNAALQYHLWNTANTKQTRGGGGLPSGHGQGRKGTVPGELAGGCVSWNNLSQGQVGSPKQKALT